MSAALFNDPRIAMLFALHGPLLKALRRAGDTHAIGDVADMILRGAVQFFGDEKGACLTEIVSYPRRKVLNVWLVFGELGHCLSLQAEMDKFAREQGCSALMATGREGWLPFLNKQGWTKFGTVYARELTHE
jgi:hypothetical protein